MTEPPHPLVLKAHHTAGAPWPDDGPVPASEHGYGLGFFHGILSAMATLALVVFAAVVLG